MPIDGNYLRFCAQFDPAMAAEEYCFLRLRAWDARREAEKKNRIKGPNFALFFSRHNRRKALAMYEPDKGAFQERGRIDPDQLPESLIDNKHMLCYFFTVSTS